MGKFCTSCGAALNEDAKFCTACGAKAEQGNETKKAITNTVKTVRNTVSSTAKRALKNTASPIAGDALTNLTPAMQTAGEAVLPVGSTPAVGDIQALKLIPTLISGIKSFFGGFKNIFKDKKRLIVVIVLVVIWLVVNILAALDVFPLPIRILSLLTAARGSVVGGTIAKGVVAAFFAQLICDKGTFGGIKSGLSQLPFAIKGDKKSLPFLLFGAGAALIVSNIMTASTAQNLMVSISAFLLSAKALSGNGFLRRIITALAPKAGGGSVTKIMSGWVLGFALFALVSLLPGRQSGIWLGVALIAAGGIMLAVANNRKEATL